MKKAAMIMIALVIFMIGSGYAVNVKPGDTARLEDGSLIRNASEHMLEIKEYSGFQQVHILPGDSLGMNGVWYKNFTVKTITTQVKLFSFSTVFKETLKLNPQFKDVNNIQPGDTVFLSPLYKGGFIQYMIAKKADLLAGKHDCIWRICQRYYAGELETKPIELTIIPAPIKETDEATVTFNWWGWILLLLAFILLAGFIYWLVRRVLEEASRNPDNHPAVIEGGLSNDTITATGQIQQHLPEGSRVVRLERGKLKRWYGPKRLLTNMNFSDRQRPAYIRPGEKVVRVTIEDQNGLRAVQYWRSHCGNRFSVVARDQFNLHQGWEFIVEVEYTPQASTESTAANSEDTAPLSQENASAPISQPIATEPANTSAEAAAPADNSTPAAQNGHPAEPKKELSNFDKFLNLVPKDNIQELRFEDNAEFGMSVNVLYKN